VLAWALAVGVLVLGGSGYAAADEGSLERLGRFVPPKGINFFLPVGIDPMHRRLYMAATPTGTFSLLEYDLTRQIPALRRTAPLAVEGGIMSPNTVAMDPERKRAFVLGQGVSTCPRCSVIHTLDLKTLTLRPEVSNLTLMVPNFYAAGVTYSAEDDRLYAVGMVLGSTTVEADVLVGLPTSPVAVVAIDAASGALAWARVLPECQHAAVASGGGGAIFRSKRLRALYVPCIRPDPTAAFTVGAYPGQSTLMRLWIESNSGSMEAAGFRSEVFPISGKYTSGRGIDAMAVMDEAADRVYMINTSSQTSGAWVFDGLLSSWVGFIPAVDETNLEIGLDQSTGHMYMRSGQDSTIIVSDGRSTPVPQGDAFPIPTLGSTNWYLADPATHRLFVRSTNPDPGPQSHQMLVLLDRTRSAEPPNPIDYDSLTTDVAEGLGTVAAFAGSSNGFGARITLVGGYGGVISPLTETLARLSMQPPSLGLSPGPRGVTLGNVASIDLRNVGASAAAQALAPDAVTGDEYQTRLKELGEAAGEAGKSIPETLAWSWPAAACLDAGEQKTTGGQQQTIGRSSVACDLKGARATGTAVAEGVVTDGLSIAGASFTSTVVRTSDEGTVTEATAAARGVEVTIEGVGSLSIGRVTATARTAAHGRPGTAGVSWTREIDGVLLRDTSGKVLFRCPDACSPKALAQAVNERVGQRIRISVPDADQVATPRGAFAGIRETRKDYFDGLIVNDDDAEAVPALELLIINDTAEKSRLHVRLAAIQASSTYGISLLPNEGELTGPPSIPLPGLPPAPDPGPPLGPPLGAPPPSLAGGAGLATTRSSVLAVRSAADALFVSLICVLILTTAAAGVRRHKFAALLNGGIRR
jgi:hypothetical protein